MAVQASVFPDIDVCKGTTIVFSFQWLINGATHDLTGYTYRCVIRQTAKSAGVLATFAVTVTDAVNNVFTLTLNATSSQAINEISPAAVWDFAAISPSGAVTKLVGGNVLISQLVSHA